MKLLIIALITAISFGCSDAAKPVTQNTNSAAVGSSPERPQTAIAHGPQIQMQNPSESNGGKSKWTQSGDPIDTTGYDAAIIAAERAFGAKPTNDTVKSTLAAAYLKRAVALTDARQYAAALGDYRRCLKYDPSNVEAKDWIEQIISIYESIGRESPRVGEEPPPLPFAKPK
jgi:tetratricopeptide (TPR) repeat protein